MNLDNDVSSAHHRIIGSKIQSSYREMLSQPRMSF